MVHVHMVQLYAFTIHVVYHLCAFGLFTFAKFYVLSYMQPVGLCK